MLLKPALALHGNEVVCFVGAGGKTSLMFRLANDLAANGESVLTTTTTKILTPNAQQSPHVVLAKTSQKIATEARKYLGEFAHVSAACEEMPDQPGKLRGLSPAMIDTLHQHRLAKWILVEGDGAAGRPLKAPAMHEPVVPESTSHAVVVIGLDSIGKPLNETAVFRSERFSHISGLAMGQAITERAIVGALRAEHGLLKGCPKHAARVIFLNKADSPERLAAGKRIVQLVDEEPISGITQMIIGSAKSHIPIVESHDFQ